MEYYWTELDREFSIYRKGDVEKNALLSLCLDDDAPDTLVARVRRYVIQFTQELNTYGAG